MRVLPAELGNYLHIRMRLFKELAKNHLLKWIVWQHAAFVSVEIFS